MVPLLHAADVSLHEALWRLGKVARALPDLTIVAIEPFFTHDGMNHCSFIADVAPNVVFETASCFDTDMLLGFIARFGAERVIFGSQYYSRIVPPGQTSAHQRRCLALLRDLVDAPSLTERDKARILGANARTVLGMPSAASF